MLSKGSLATFGGALLGGIAQAIALPDWSQEGQWRLVALSIGILSALVFVTPVSSAFEKRAWKRSVWISLGLLALALIAGVLTLALFPLHDWLNAPQFKIWAFCTFVFFHALGLFFGLLARFALKSYEKDPQ
jgi:hypothetical protein